MARRVTFKNYPRLLKKLKALQEATAGPVAVALGQGADRVVALAKRLCPVDRGDLRDSIGWTFGDAPKGSVHIASGKVGSLKITIFAGDEKAYYARFVEFGTKYHAAQAPRRNRKFKSIFRLTKAKREHFATPAQPFFFPAWRALKKSVKSELAKVIKQVVKEVVQQT